MIPRPFAPVRLFGNSLLPLEGRIRVAWNWSGWVHGSLRQRKIGAWKYYNEWPMSDVPWVLYAGPLTIWRQVPMSEYMYVYGEDA